LEHVAEQKEAARRLGITPRALRDWAKEPGFPDWSAGYDLQAIRRWRDQHGRKGSDDDGTSRKLKLAIAAEKLRQAKLETRKRELDLQTKEGQLLPRQAVETFASTLLSALADWCEQLPDLIAGELPKKHGAKIAARLTRELHQCREQLAEDLKRLPES
jgi:transposase-like protein